MQKAIKKERTLAFRFPKIAKEWNYEKNGDLNPKNVAAMSNKRVWWECGVNSEHQWDAVIQNRTGKSDGCPFCSGRRATKENCLAVTNSKLAKEWHPAKNRTLTPYDVLSQSGQKVWWRCSVNPEHEWDAIIQSRTKGSGCPYCSGRYATPETCLATVNPELALEWHPTKNGLLTPNDVTSNSGQKVWWKCNVNPEHEWLSIIGNRKKGNGCPHCSKHTQTSLRNAILLFYFRQVGSDVAEEYVIPNSTKRLDLFIKSLKLGIEYDGERYHQNTKRDIEKDEKLWKELPDVRIIRIREPNCPRYSSPNPNLHFVYLSDLTYKTLEQVIHQLLQHLVGSPENGVNISRDRTEIRNLIEYQTLSESFQTHFPDLAAEWHPTKNGILKPSEIKSKSNLKVWWQCKHGYEWETTVLIRARLGNIGHRNCHECKKERDEKASVEKERSLIYQFPLIAAEWHSTKNGGLSPSNVTAKSSKKVWWNCKHGYEWEAIICARTKKGYTGHRYCPQCRTERKISESKQSPVKTTKQPSTKTPIIVSIPTK